mgnify:CR=1 FL=1
MNKVTVGGEVNTYKIEIGTVTLEPLGGRVSNMSIGELRSKKVGRYLSEDIAGKAYNLASELIFGEGNPYLHLNDLDRDYTEVNLNCKFFKYWVPVMRTEYLKLYEQEED